VPDPVDSLDDAPLVVDARKLAKLLCCGVRTIRTWDQLGKLPKAIRIGGGAHARVYWLVDEIRDWLKAGAPDRERWELMRAAQK
jgi:hypothetical protein